MDFSEIYRFTIFALFLDELFGICGAMLLLQMGIVNPFILKILIYADSFLLQKFIVLNSFRRTVAALFYY